MLYDENALEEIDLLGDVLVAVTRAPGHRRLADADLDRALHLAAGDAA